MPKQKKDYPNWLLVEGFNDLNSVVGLMNMHTNWGNTKETAPVWIERMEGVHRVLSAERIGVILKNRRLQSLGILIDANSSCKSRYQRIHQILKEFLPNIPDQLPRGGVIECDDKGRRFGVWVMPDNSSTGAIEDFLLKLIPECRKPLFMEIEKNVLQIEEISPFKENHRSKSLIYSLLAIQDPPSCNFRKAFGHGLLDPMHTEANSFVNWFLTLYQLKKKTVKTKASIS